MVDTGAHAAYRAALEEQTRRAGAALGLRPDALELIFRQRLARDRGRAAADLLEHEVGVSGKHVLDVGAGFGELVLELFARGADVRGVEPDEEAARIARLLLESHGVNADSVSVGRGEALPFPDACFDIVTCHNVLEHVQEVDRVVGEMVRVARPDATLLVSVPNYLFPYEGHYRMKWVPLAPKRLAARVLRAKGRDPAFLLRHVRYTTYPGMMRLWRRHGLVARNMTEEDVRSRRHQNALYASPLMRFLALRLKLYPNVTWLLRNAAR